MLGASSTRRREAHAVLYVGMDLSRKRLDFEARFANGGLFERGGAARRRRAGRACPAAGRERGGGGDRVDGRPASSTIGSSSRAGTCGSLTPSRPKG